MAVPDANGPPSDLDLECYDLCLALNSYPGIRTSCSCCGHGKDPYRIWFSVDSLVNLPAVLYWFARCHSGHAGWRVLAETDCAMSPAHFLVEGPVGDDGYQQAKEIARLLVESRDGVVCPSCGNSTWRVWDEDVKYCESCGHQTGDDVEETTEVEAASDEQVIR